MQHILHFKRLQSCYKGKRAHKCRKCKRIYQGSKTQPGPLMVEREKRVWRESNGQKRSSRVKQAKKDPPRVKRAKGSAEGALRLPLVDFPTTLQKMPRVSPGPADIPYSCIRARSSIGSPEHILQQGERKVLDVFSEGKKCR